MESSEAGLPIVFVHGLRVSGTMWRPVIHAIGPDHPTAAPDLPGHGSRRGEPFSMAGAVAAVADTIDQLGGRALLVGLSLGGFVATATAGAHPERVLGLVAMGCSTRPSGLFAAAYRAASRLAARHPQGADRLSAFAFRRTLPGPPGEALAAGGLSSRNASSVLTAVCETDTLASLSAYPGPVWLVNGERDHFRRDERQFLAACRDGRLLLLPRCGHLTGLADTKALAGLVRDAAAVVTARTSTAAAPGGLR
ncbi:alpha/beta fold hydrolase [Streptomyces kronopolitis]|uniref:alpha/beta fold hydrolase n=1 Tax=Streptomyces kronopolitis TaxID=1612435 RepID=UPI0036CB0C21